jgi:hypothetical protein
VHNALCNNPFLDADETEPEAVAVEPTPVLATDEVMAASAPVEEETYGDTLAGSSSDADLESERESWQADGFSANRRGEDGDLTAMDMMAVETSLAEYLHGQLNVMSLSQRDLVLAKVVVESLDDDGYLRLDLPELGDIAELEPPPRPRNCRSRCGWCSRSTRPASRRATSANACCCSCRRSRTRASAIWRAPSSPSTSTGWRPRTSTAWPRSSAARRPRSRQCATASAGSTRGPAGASAPRRCST